MTTLRQAAQQALEALEGELPDWRTPAQARAVIALRDALAQEEQPKLAPAPGWCKHCRQYTVEEPLLAQQEQEPVLTMNKMGSLVECSPTVRAFDLSDGEYKLYTHPPRREWQGLTEQAEPPITHAETLLREALPGAEWQDKHIYPVRGKSYQNWLLKIYLPVPLSAKDKSPEKALERALKEKNQ